MEAAMSVDRPAFPTDAAIEALLARRVDVHHLSRGMVVGLTDTGGHRVIAHGYGDTAKTRRVDADTLFEIGSITKLFTATLLADMIGKGEVIRDERVQDLLPAGVGVPERNGRAITLFDLVTHRAGLPRMPADFGLDHQTNPDRPYTADLLYAFLASHRLTRTPGDDAVYSNLGFGLLGHALSLRAGVDYEALLRTRVLAPLGLFRTAITPPPSLADALAIGHDDALDPVPPWCFGTMASAGALRSSAADLLLFLDALRDPVASPVGEALALLSRAREDGGLGLATPHPDGGMLLSHTGGTGGFRSYAGCLPAWDRGVVVLSNAAIEATADLGLHLLDGRYGLARFRTEVPVETAHFTRLTGRYRLGPTQIFTITTTGDRLMAQLSGQAAFRVFPSSAWTYFYRCVGAQLVFERGADGCACRLVLHQNGAERYAERID